jgi:hypothetical protein
MTNGHLNGCDSLFGDSITSPTGTGIEPTDYSSL